jgi:aspartate/methionine/tyrosine aminotransferase
MTLVDAGDEVLVPDPGYPSYPVVVRLLGGTPVSYPLRAARSFRIDPDDVLSRMTDRTRLVILCSPSNPTGAIDLPEDLSPLAAALNSRGRSLAVRRDLCGLLVRAPAVSISRFAPQGGIVVSGLSKDLSMTGWRIGWLVGRTRSSRSSPRLTSTS